jgi:glycosyltransferase involved in cell wall biosynthesis
MPLTPSSVLMVTPTWTRDGGVAAHVKASAAVLAERGVAVSVLAARVDPGDELAGVTLFRGPQLLDRSAPPEARMAGALASEPELIHFHQVEEPELVTFARRGAPVVVSAHVYPACTSGVYYFRPGQECTRAHGPGCIPNLIAGGCAHTRYPRTLPRKYLGATRAVAALESCDLAVSYSTAVDRHLAANGIANRLIVPYFPTMPTRTGIGHAERRRVVFAGRMVRTKGVDVLIRAAGEVDAELVLCGSGRELDAMRGLAERLGIRDRTRFEGWLDAGQLAQELADASVVVMPSLWPEPFGLVGIEALAAGRPAVASMTGGIGDWLEHGVNGLGVPPGDSTALASALNELLADPDRQEAMGLAGRRMVAAAFSGERHVETLFEGYRTATAGWQRARPVSA